MKKRGLLLYLLATTFIMNAQNVGIGTPTPDATALLHIDLGSSTTKGLLVNGTFNGASTVPNLGTGSRMMFYPGKAAFRAGYATGAYWDNANVGYCSSAMGASTIASSFTSFATGSTTTASGVSSFAMGNTTTASGASSFAMGSSSIASGDNSIAM